MTARGRVCLALQGLAAAALGLLLGAQIAEGAVLVSWWRAIPPAEFLAWYAANAERLLGFFGPLTAAATALAVAAGVMCIVTRSGGRALAVVAATLVVLVVVGFFVYFEQANTSFATGTIRAEDVPAALAAWATWHWARVGVMSVAFAASLWSLVQSAGSSMRA